MLPQQYVDWCAGGNLDAFFTNSNCQQIYQKHVSTFVNRCCTICGAVKLQRLGWLQELTGAPLHLSDQSRWTCGEDCPTPPVAC